MSQGPRWHIVFANSTDSLSKYKSLANKDHICTSQFGIFCHKQLQFDFCILKSLILASRTCRNQSLSGREIQIGAIKTIFSPLSSFFGFRIILLGRFNGQGLPPAGVEHLYRITKGQTRDFFPLENKFQVKNYFRWGVREGNRVPRSRNRFNVLLIFANFPIDFHSSISIYRRWRAKS